MANSTLTNLTALDPNTVSVVSSLGLWVSDTGTPKLVSADIMQNIVGLPLNSTVIRSTDQGAPVATVTTVTWQGALNDPLGMYSTSAPGYLTIPCPGYYQIGYGIRIGNSTTTPITGYMLKNGLSFHGASMQRWDTLINEEWSSWSSPVLLSSGDQMSINLFPSSNTRTISGSLRTFFAIQPLALYLDL